MGRGGKAAPERDAGEQIGVQPKVKVCLAFTADGAGQVDDDIRAGEDFRPVGNQPAKVALNPLTLVGAAIAGAVGNVLVDKGPLPNCPLLSANRDPRPDRKLVRQKTRDKSIGACDHD